MGVENFEEYLDLETKLDDTLPESLIFGELFVTELRARHELQYCGFGRIEGAINVARASSQTRNAGLLNDMLTRRYNTICCSIN